MAPMRRDFLPPDAQREMRPAGFDALRRGAGASESRRNRVAARRSPIAHPVHRRRRRLGRPALGRRSMRSSKPWPPIRSWSACGTSCRRSPMASCSARRFGAESRRLEHFGLAYDILVYARQLPRGDRVRRALSERRGSCSIISAKPDIRVSGPSPTWRRDLNRLAEQPNVFAKLSGLVTEADWRGWTPVSAAPVSRCRVRCVRRGAADDRIGLARVHGGGTYARRMAVVVAALEGETGWRA